VEYFNAVAKVSKSRTLREDIMIPQDTQSIVMMF